MRRRHFLAAAAAIPLTLGVAPAMADDAANLAEDAQTALSRLLEADPRAKDLADASVAALVFPRILKAGVVVGGSYGEGALLKDGAAEAFYNSVAASYGLQLGAQTFGYALFFMNEEALSYLDRSDGWEIGSGPSVVVVDEGLATRMSSTTLSQDVYAVFFNQTGLMAGLGIEGSKISRIDP
ncbi:MAG: YSC84-related protein [Pseudomonadota bacterium]